MNVSGFHLVAGDGLSELVEPLGWVLIHSLWQFSLLAVLLVVAQRLLRRRSAAAQYLASSLTLLSMTTCAAVTLFVVSSPRQAESRGGDVQPAANVQFVSRADDTPSHADAGRAESDWLLAAGDSQELREESNALDASDSQDTASASHVNDEGHRPLMLRREAEPGLSKAITMRALISRVDFSSRLRQWLPFCVTAWIVGMTFGALRLAVGGIGVRRLRRHGRSAVSGDVQRLLAETAERMGIRRGIEIAESSLVVGPVVIGWLKPLILLPAASLTGLSTQQLEAVLAHEIAHIRRFDYVVNLLQLVIETIFFYHPAVWWVSRRMRIHREDCCDDRAVSIVATSLTYASALLTLHELQSDRAASNTDGFSKASPPTFVLSATGGSLKKRIHRVLGLDTHLPAAPLWWISTSVVGFMVFFAGCVLFAQSPLADDPKSKAGENQESTSKAIAAEPLVQVPAPEPEPTPNESPSVPLARAVTAEEREQVLRQLESLGLSRSRAFGIPVGRLPLPNVYNATLFDEPEAAWPLLGRLYMVRRLDMTASRVSAEAFRNVVGMSSLQHLSVTNSRFTSKHLESLASLKRLETIDVKLSVFEQPIAQRQVDLGELSDAEQQRFEEIAGPENRYDHIAQAAILTDRAMQKLSGLSKLRSLKLVNTFVSNVGVLALNKMLALDDVELSVGGNLSREAADVFGAMKQLETLKLLCRIDADAATGLQGATSLTDLELRGIDDEVAAVLAEMSSLQRLRLWASSLSDEGLLRLAKLEKLEKLDVRYAHTGTFTKDGIARFQSARPGCNVMHTLNVKTLTERSIPLPKDHFIVRLRWRKATSRQQLSEHLRQRFGKSEHWIEFQPLTREGYVGGIALMRGAAGKDWLLAQIGTDGDYDVAYAEPISYRRLKDEGVLFDAVLKLATESSDDPAKTTPGRPAKAGTPSDPSTTTGHRERSPAPIVAASEPLPPFQVLLARLRERGQNKTADGLQARYEQKLRVMGRPISISSEDKRLLAYGLLVAPTGSPPRLCNAPMKIFDGGWFVAGIGNKDAPVGFRMFGCKPIDVVPSELVPNAQAGGIVSLGRIVMEPYPQTELATLRGRLKFPGDAPPNGIRARVLIDGGPTNSLSGGTDGFLEWPEKENVTLTSDLQFEHRQLAPLPHRLHIEAPGYQSVSRRLDLTAGATLDLGTIDVAAAPQFHLEILASETPDFTDAPLRRTTVPLGQVWKSNPDNEALRKYSGGDMRFIMFPVDRRKPDGEQKLILHSGVASLRLAEVGEGQLEALRETIGDPKLRSNRDVTVESGHVYITYHTHWKHWTLLRVTIK